MGHHYVPQKYLENFTLATTGKLWVYEKASSKSFISKPKSVANENKYYSDEVESYLAGEIESPANQVIAKIIKRQALTDQDKLALARYMVVMIKRVPKGKEILRQSLPQAAKSVHDKINSKLEAFAKEDLTQTADTEKFRQRVAEILDGYVSDMPKEVWLNTLPPEWTPKIVQVIYRMSWQILMCDTPAFLTCDNPIFFNRSLGLGKPESELTFPISSSLALHAAWPAVLERETSLIKYTKVNRQVIRHLNQRTVINATRHIFYCRDEKWIPEYIAKNRQWQNA